MRRRLAALALLTLVATAGCGGTTSSGGVPTDPAPPPGLTLRLEPAQAPAGGLFTLRIEGRAAAAIDMSVAADFQRWDGSTWRTEYLLDSFRSGGTGPVVARVGELHFVPDMSLVGTQPLALKVPPVAPGEYRIVKEVTRGRSSARQRMVLYSRLRVVG
jgi:hypothetical protein